MSLVLRITLLLKDIKRIWSLIWETDRLLAIVNMFLQLIQAILPVLSLYYIKQLIENVTNTEMRDVSGMYQSLIMFGIMLFLISVTSLYASYINTIFGQKITDYLSGTILRKAVDIDYEYYEKPAYHDTLHLAQQQSIHRAPALLTNFNALLLNSTSLVFLVIFFLTLNSLFALWFILLSVPLALIKWRFSHSIVQQERKLVPMVREANYIHNSLTNASTAKEVRVLWFGDVFIGRFRNLRAYIFNEKNRLNLKLANYSMFAETVEIVVMLFLFSLLAKSAIDGAITVGTFVIYIQGFQRLQSTARNFLQSVVQTIQQKNFLKDLFSFLDIELSSTMGRQLSFPVVKKGLSVRNLSFTYPLTDRQVLHDINLHCSPRSIVAIVGENGSGKSTLVKLLARLYQLQTGSITIDDVAVADISIEGFRDNSTFLFQDYEKHLLTIEENIALGSKKVPNSESIMQAATLSGAAGFISKFPDGYKTRLGKMFDNGAQLSGGEWQKISISRVFYKQADLIVLDEPTSALDVFSEAVVFENIKKELDDKMVVLISHRLYNLKIADIIYVMKDGKIEEVGTFDSLIANEGHFRKMYDAQKL